MGSKYKKQLEVKWDGKCTADIKAATLQKQADANISKLCRGECKRISRRLK